MGVNQRSSTSIKRRLVMTLVLAIALGGFVWVAMAPTGNDPPARPDAVEGVFPEGGDLDLRQTAIYADLAPGYTGYLLFDGTEVPADDLQFTEGINTVTLKPTAYSDLARLEPGRHCVTVVYRRIGNSSDGGQYQWCFRLH